MNSQNKASNSLENYVLRNTTKNPENALGDDLSIRHRRESPIIYRPPIKNSFLTFKSNFLKVYLIYISNFII